MAKIARLLDFCKAAFSKQCGEHFDNARTQGPLGACKMPGITVWGKALGYAESVPAHPQSLPCVSPQGESKGAGHARQCQDRNPHARVRQRLRRGVLASSDHLCAAAATF